MPTESAQSHSAAISDKIPDMPDASSPSDPALAPAAPVEVTAADAPNRNHPGPRIGILVVAYNAESHLRSVLHRIPQPIVDKIDEIFIFDDASRDNTVEVGRACKDELPHA